MTPASTLLAQPGQLFGRVARWTAGFMPKGLYARSLIIIIAPVVLLQSVIAYVFMERHYELVTRRLSQAVSGDIAALIEVYEGASEDTGRPRMLARVGERMGLDVALLPPGPLPPAGRLQGKVADIPRTKPLVDNF